MEKNESSKSVNIKNAIAGIGVVNNKPTQEEVDRANKLVEDTLLASISAQEVRVTSERLAQTARGEASRIAREAVSMMQAKTAEQLYQTAQAAAQSAAVSAQVAQVAAELAQKRLDELLLTK